MVDFDGSRSFSIQLTEQFRLHAIHIRIGIKLILLDFHHFSIRSILESGASVNIYMFFGGTNFGFTAGEGKSYSIAIAFVL